MWGSPQSRKLHLGELRKFNSGFPLLEGSESSESAQCFAPAHVDSWYSCEWQVVGGLVNLPESPEHWFSSHFFLPPGMQVIKIEVPLIYGRGEQVICKFCYFIFCNRFLETNHSVCAPTTPAAPHPAQLHHSLPASPCQPLPNSDPGVRIWDNRSSSLGQCPAWSCFLLLAHKIYKQKEK